MKKTIVLAALLVIILVIGYQFLKLEGSLEQQKMDADFETERITTTGKIVGFKEDNNSHAWYGIPFAKAPIGELRWKAPIPANKWEDTRKAVEFGPICTQFADMGAQGRASKKEYGNPVGSEDCLFLNIWAPAFSPDSIPQGNDRLPVMVWIHGGGNSIGHGSSNNGKILAEKYNLVLVTLNYRLGPFGWFTHPAIREEGTTPEDQSGSYGTLDIIRALTWVQENIENFGGNPENVTIFGESAGGRNSLSMILAPKAKGLFHKAIIQSGSLGAKSIASAENYKDA
ncbi:MAG: carboxylesterase family protein, partial [Desulfobacterales bacterium]|nr:carboxylesterase family protein [Desulfobacterales bacterium]